MCEWDVFGEVEVVDDCDHDDCDDVDEGVGAFVLFHCLSVFVC